MIWLGVFIIALIVEVITMGIYSIWFAIGALVAFALGFFELSIIVQAGVFVVVSFVLLIVVRPMAVNSFNNGNTRSKKKGLVGEDVYVITEINSAKRTGLVQIGTAEWTAIAKNKHEVYPYGSIVRIVKVTDDYVVVTAIK